MSNDENEKNPGRVRRFFGNRVRPIKNLVNPVIGEDAEGNEIRSMGAGSSFGRIFRTIGQALGLLIGWFLPSKGREDEVGVPFNDIAKRWGLTPGNLHQIKRGLRVEQIAYGLLALLGLSQIVVGIMAMGGPFWPTLSRVFLGSMTLFAAFLMMAMATWRLDVINQKAYRPFATWLRGG